VFKNQKPGALRVAGLTSIVRNAGKRLCRQCLEISFVALCSQFLSAAKQIISTAANYLGAFGAGSPGGVSLPTVIKI